MKREITTIICDWSGTLSDDRIPVWMTNNILLKNYKLPQISYDDFFLAIAPTLRQFMEERKVKVNLDKLNEEFLQVYQEVTRNENPPMMYQDTQEFLEYLKSRGKTIVVLSTHPQQFVESEARMYGIHTFFDEIIGGVQDKALGLEQYCESLGVRPQESVYVCDTAWDTISARKANILPLTVSRGYHSRERLEKHLEREEIFNNLIEIIDSRLLE